MTDSIGLVCAVLASLAIGVWMAYGVCLLFFRMLGGRTVGAPKAVTASVAAMPAEG